MVLLESIEAFLLDPTTVTLARVQAFLLIFIRVTGIFQNLPILSGGTVPVQVRIWASFTLALVLFGVVLSQQTTPVMPQSIGIFVIAALVEWSLGLLIGFIGGLLLTGYQIAGRLVDDQLGFSMANVIDPTTNESMSVTGQITFMVGVLLFVVMGGINMVIEVLAMSFNIVPLLAFNLSDNVISHVVLHTFPQSLALAIAFAAPTICVVLLSTVGLGLMGKIVPEMNIFAFSFGVRVLLGLVILRLTMGYLPDLAEIVREGTEYHLRYALDVMAVRVGP